MPSARLWRSRTTHLIVWLLAAICVLAACGRPDVESRPTPNGLTATEVSFHGAGGVELRGTIIAPARADPRSPGLVMVHGAGPVRRDEYRDEAEAFARRGIVTLIYDKRTIGYSTVERDFSVLAEDAMAALRLLQRRSDVDSENVGLWGLSEGGWVAPLAASRSTDVAFVIVVGAVGMTPVRQQAWAYGEFLVHAGVTSSLLHTMQVTGMKLLVGLHLFAQAHYDPVPAWETVTQPVLALWGTLDREAAPEESSRIIQQALDRAGNTRSTIDFVPGVRHNLNITADDGFDRAEGLRPDYGDREAAWILGLAGGTTGASAATAPQQDRRTGALAEAAWYEAPGLQLGVLAFLFLAFAGYMVAALVPGVRRRRKASPMRQPAIWLAVTGLTAVVGFTFYFLFLVFTATNVIGPVLLGRPIPWLLLQILAGAALVTLGWTIIRGLRLRQNHPDMWTPALCVLLGAGVLFVPWATYWGLLAA